MKRVINIFVSGLLTFGISGLKFHGSTDKNCIFAFFAMHSIDKISLQDMIIGLTPIFIFTFSMHDFISEIFLSKNIYFLTRFCSRRVLLFRRLVYSFILAIINSLSVILSFIISSDIFGDEMILPTYTDFFIWLCTLSVLSLIILLLFNCINLFFNSTIGILLDVVVLFISIILANANTASFHSANSLNPLSWIMIIALNQFDFRLFSTQIMELIVVILIYDLIIQRIDIGLINNE